MLVDMLHITTGSVHATAPFDLRQSIRAVAGFSPCSGEQTLTASTITKAICLEGRAVVITLAALPGGVRYRATSEQGLPLASENALRTWVRNYLSLDDDLTDFYAAAASDPTFAPIAEHLHGLHQVRFPSVVEAAVWFVLTQRAHQSVSRARKRTITDTYGPDITVDGVRHRAFPDLDQLLTIDEASWQAIVRNEGKAGYLVSVLRGLAEIGVDHLATADYADATAALRGIRGVGEFTAAAILLRGLGRMNHVPLDMPSFDGPARMVYGDAFNPDAVRAHYGVTLGYWSYYLKNATSADTYSPTARGLCSASTAALSDAGASAVTGTACAGLAGLDRSMVRTVRGASGLLT